MKTEQAGMRGTILCIEDEPYLRQDILDELHTAGYRAIGAEDGVEALATLENRRPDLILCDISMPQLDGYELLAHLRSKRPDLADVPFVFLTALNQRDEIISGKRAGADDYLVKPIDYDLLLASIEARLQQVQRINSKLGQELDSLRAALAKANAGDHSGLHRILDLLAFGVVLIGAEGRLFTNQAARALHEANDGLRITPELQTGSAHLNRQLRKQLESCRSAARQGRELVASLSVPRPSGRRDLLLIACALPAVAGEGCDDPLAVIFLSDPERRPELPGSVLSELFELTPTESEVARALAHGRRTDQIAGDLGVSQTTVAFHLRNLFDKTGTNRQADLIALVLTALATLPQGALDGGTPAA
ncbi:response regulator [Fodinicurvata sediminis]|uniref:response regulator n=1 Tax=Fodinicurvata sediminis TaxID=1121832 RepID=UPI001B7FBA94|nr:response regulator [Fodinicurvata sediminis]